MIVTDLFHSVNFNDVWKIILKKMTVQSEEEKRQSEACHKASWNKIINMAPADSGEHIIVFYNQYETDIETKENLVFPESSLFEIREIKEKIKKKPFKTAPNFTQVEQMPLEEINSQFRRWSSDFPVCYAYEFSKWEEILGYTVDPVSVELVGRETALALIFFEMTFLGFEEGFIQEELEKLNRLHQQVLEDIDRRANGEEPLYTSIWKKTEDTEIPRYTEDMQKRDRINDFKTLADKYKSLYNAEI